MILFLMVTNGFSITSGSIPSWLKWIYWWVCPAWSTGGAAVCCRVGQDGTGSRTGQVGMAPPSGGLKQTS